jgi:hypothetical protein
VGLGLQAFSGAKAFSANIGAWNTASIKTMFYVCALCHRLCVRHVCLGLGCGTARPISHLPRPVEAAAMLAACVLNSFLEFYYVS